MDRERHQREQRRQHRDHDRAQPHDAGVEEGIAQGLPLGVVLLDEIEEHDHVAHDHADQARDPEEAHEPEGLAHDPEPRQRPHDAVGHGGEDEDRLDQVVELDHERDEDQRDGDGHDDAELREPRLLLGLGAGDGHLVARRQIPGEGRELRARRVHDLRGVGPGHGEALHGDRAEVLEAADPLRLHRVAGGGHHRERGLLGARRRVHVQALHVGEPRALLQPEPRHHRDLPVPLAERGHLVAADPGRGRPGDVLVRDPRQVGAVRVDVELHHEALLVPVVAEAGGHGDRPEDVGQPLAEPAEPGDLLPGPRRVGVRAPADLHLDGDPHRVGLELAGVGAGAVDGRRHRRLQPVHQRRRVFLVGDLDDELRVVLLALLGRERVPEARPAASHEGGDRPEHLPRLAVTAGALLAVLRRDLAHPLHRARRDLVGPRERHVVRQPEVHIGEVLEIGGEELGGEARHEEHPGRQEDQGHGEGLPAMLQHRHPDPVVEAGEPPAAQLLDRGLAALGGAQQVVAEQRDEGHRGEPGGDQGAGHDDGQGSQEVAGGAAQHEEGQVGDDVGDRREEDGLGELGGPEPGGDDPRVAEPQVPLDGVARHHRVVDEQAQRDDQRGDRDLLELDAQREHHPERHRQRDRDGQRHQDGRAPLPESHQGHQDHEDDGLVQRVHEQGDVFLHLARLVRGPRQDEVGGELGPEPRQRAVHGAAEVGDLLARPHLDGEGDRGAPVPGAGGVLPVVVVQEARRALIAARDLDEIAQVDGVAGGVGGHDHAADLVLALELPRRVEGHIGVLEREDPARQGGVARPEDGLDGGGLDAVRGELGLRVLEEDLLGEDARALDRRHLRDLLQRALDQVGDVVELAVGVPGTGDLAEPGLGVLRIPDHHRRPAVRVESGSAEAVAGELAHGPEEGRVVQRRRRVEPDESRSLDRAHVPSEPALHQVTGREIAHPPEDRGIDELRVRDHDGDPGSASRRRPGADLADGAGDRPRAQRDDDRALRGAGHGEHQRRRVPEVAVELDRPGALGEGPVQVVQLDGDVAELLAGVGSGLVQLDLDEGDAGERHGLDAEVPGLGRVHAGVLRDPLLDGPGDELLHLLRAHPGPLGDGDRDPHGDVRILPLGHVDVPVDSPEDHAGEQHPGDVTLLGEEASGVVRVPDQLLVGPAVGHGTGMLFTGCPSARSVAPLTTTRSPRRTPSRTTIRLPSTSPRTTGRRRAIGLPAWSSRTKTA